MRIAFIAMAIMAAAPLAQAEGKANGEHPAIVARRVIASQGYDYASAFYLHPAGLALATRPAAAVNDSPDEIVAKHKGGPHPAAPRAASRK